MTMDRATQIIIASMVVGIVVAVIWFAAPLVPALVGTVAAGVLLYRWRGGRPE